MPTSKSLKIGLLGPYGWGNLGDAAIQEAMIEHIRRYHSEAQIYGFSQNPEDTEKRHGIPSFPITRMPKTTRLLLEKVPRRFRSNRLPKKIMETLERILIRAPMELALIPQALKNLSNFDILIVSGGGQLDDYWGGALAHPYTLFKWAVIAKLKRTKFIFVSVGAGPIDSPLSKWFIKAALSMASYRSYRDEDSKNLLASIGFKRNDPVYPDLAYSLEVPAEKLQLNHPDSLRPVVGIGPMTYFLPGVWPDGDISVYNAYLEKLASFASWLIQNHYKIVLLPGVSIADGYAIRDLIGILNRNAIKYSAGQVVDDSVSTVDDLIAKISSIDIVVATRLHSVITAHVLHKPVLAISYHRKIDVLMAEFGQSAYCLPIDTFDVETLIKQFTILESNRDIIRKQVMQRAQEYREALDRQYDHIFSQP